MARLAIMFDNQPPEPNAISGLDLAEQEAAVTLAKFDENEARDEHGKWTAGGGGGKALKDHDLELLEPKWDNIKHPQVRRRAQDAVDRWLGPEYLAVNKALRQGDDRQPVVRGLDAAFGAGHNLSEDVVVYRGIDDPNMQFEVGQVITDKGFVATSTDEREAEAFTQDMQGSKVGTLVRIKVPAGTRVISPRVSAGLEEGEPAGVEPELLLNRGTKFRVTAKVGRRVEMEVLP